MEVNLSDKAKLRQEKFRKRLQNNIVNYALRYDDEESRAILIELNALLSKIPVGGIAPDVYCNLLACCNKWHKITSIPFTTLCCGRVYFD